MRFVPTESFKWIGENNDGDPIVKASYVQGMEYSVRTPELEEQAKKWAEEGKVALNDAPPLALSGG